MLTLISRSPSFSLSGGAEPLPLQLSPVSQLNAQSYYWVIFAALALFVVGMVLGYVLDRQFKLVYAWYLRLQKSFPSWYASWPADRRERRLALLFGALLLVPFLLLAVTGLVSPYLAWPAVACVSGLAVGINIQAALHFRKMMMEDRPEKPPQAVLHKVNPKYSMKRALFIGQLYLRLFLPVFALFMMLVLPLSFKLIVLSALELGLLLVALFLGAALAWWAQGESHFEVERFKSNYLRLSALGLLSAGLLIFALASGNLLQLIVMGAFASYLAGLY